MERVQSLSFHPTRGDTLRNTTDTPPLSMYQDLLLHDNTHDQMLDLQIEHPKYPRIQKFQALSGVFMVSTMHVATSSGELSSCALTKTRLS